MSGRYQPLAVFPDVPVVGYGEALRLARAPGAVLATVSGGLSRRLVGEDFARGKAEGKRAWRAAEIVPYAAWLRQLWQRALLAQEGQVGAERALLTEAQERFLWREVVMGAEESERLLDPEGAAGAAQRAWHLMQAWGIPRAEVEEEGTGESERFFKWVDEYERRREAGGWIDQAMLPAALGMGAALRGACRRLILAGFPWLTPQQRGFLERLKQERVELYLAQPEEAAERREPVAAEFPDEVSELRAAARWCRQKLEEDASRRVGVVIPDVERLGRVAGRIVREEWAGAAFWDEAAERAMDAALGRGGAIKAPVVVDALAVLRELPGVGRTTKVEAWVGRVAVLERLLASPYFGDEERERDQRAQARLLLRRWGAGVISRAGWQSVANRARCWGMARGVEKFLQRWMRLPARQAPSQWVEELEGLLGELGFPGSRGLGEEERAGWEAARQGLERLAELDAVRPRMTYGEALEAAEILIREAGWEGEAPPVEILDLEEAAWAGAECLWVSGMDEERLPRRANPHPYLPVRLQQRRELPGATAAGQRAWAAWLVREWRRSAGELVVSYARKREERVLRISPLFAGWRMGEQGGVGALVRSGRAAQGKLEAWEETHGPGLERGALLEGGSNVLREQSACPFRAFARYRLRAEDTGAAAEHWDARVRGTAAHRALEEVWGQLGGSRGLRECGEEQLRAMVERALSRYYEAAFPGLEEDVFFAELFRLERRLLTGVIEELLEQEKRRGEEFVVACEQRGEVELEGLRLQVRLDRIDTLASGGQILIDYKTGEARVAAWAGERPEEPQVPLYALAARGGDLRGCFFAKLKRGEVGFEGWAVEGVELGSGPRVGDLGGLVEQWRAALRRLAEEVSKGYAAVAPRRASECERCPYPILCRKDELLSEVEETGEEEE